MKRTLIMLSLLIAGISSQAQEKVKLEDKSVKLDYSRNSLSVVHVYHEDQYDDPVFKAYLKMDWSDKFDDNIIEQQIYVSYPRTAGNTLNDRAQAIVQQLKKDDLGKQVVSFWFDRNEQTGAFSPELFHQRGLYNATDQDFKNVNAAKVKDALKDRGADLIPNSFILVIDYTKLNRTVEVVEDFLTKQKKDVAYWNTTVEAYLFRVNFTKATQDFIYDKCWIDPEDSPEVVADKKVAYDTLSIGLAPVTSLVVNVKHNESQGGFDAAIAKGFNDVIDQLEKKVEKWQVKVAVQEIKPIRAKIGTKEGLKNKSRYFVYATKEDKNQNVYSVKRGVIRATTIANNSRVSDGKTPMSEFYQIAGGRVSEGMVMQQKNDIGLAVSAGWRFGGNSGLMIQAEQLLSIKTNGNAQYVMIDFSADAYDVKDNTLYPVDNIAAMNLGIGYGYGIRLGRPIELVPNITVGAEYLNSEADFGEEEVSFTDNLGYYGTLGAKLNINIAYPLQLQAGVDYTLRLAGSERNQKYTDILKDVNKSRGGLGFFVGLKYTF